MKIFFIVIVSIISIRCAYATNYYVDAINGTYGNSGLSIAQAKNNVQGAADLTNPGDTVFILNGIYKTTYGNILTIARSGTATAGIVYTNYPGNSPKFKADSITYTILIVQTGTNYITVNGLEIEGYGVNLILGGDTAAAKLQETCPVSGSAATYVAPFKAKYNGNGISVGNNGTIGNHHITISNCKVHDCTGGGIGFGKTDYITVEGNIVYNNSWYTIYGTSGISLNNSYNYDNNTTTYRNIVKNNVCYGNRLYVPWYSICQISDGNGIILDVPLSDYNGRTLVANNICYNNGGSGIHAFKMNHVDMFNNVGYLNSASPELISGEIYARGSDDVKIYNNILVSSPNKLVNGINGSTNLVYDYNVYYGGSSVDVVGMHSLIQDPKFVSATINPATANFHLLQGSFAINNGNNTNTYSLDKDGNPRPLGSKVDMGAYESAYTGNLTDCGATEQLKMLGSGAGTGDPGTGSYYGPYDTRVASSNQKSRRAINYPLTLLAATGIPANTNITSLQFKRGINVPGSTPPTASTQTVPDNSIIKIYLRNEASDGFGSAAFDWTTILPGGANPAILVYAGEASPLVGNSGGWKTVPFQIPFTYTGANLGVFIEYLQKGAATSGTDILWVYDNSGSQPLYSTTSYPNQTYATKATATSFSGVISNSLSSNNERRPVIALGYCTNLILPVTILQFNAVKRSNSVNVSWVTGSETNNEGFDVQRSSDGRNFTSIRFVYSRAVNRTSTIENYYSFTDPSPVKGLGYYRLVQKDKDGKLTYSRIILISDKSNQLNLVSIYPNPVNEKLSASITITGTNTMATISLQDVSGRMVNSFSQQLTTGLNTINMNLSKLTGSVYLLKIELPSGESLVKKVIKN